jgi:hypothetical protein
MIKSKKILPKMFNFFIDPSCIFYDNGNGLADHNTRKSLHKLINEKRPTKWDIRIGLIKQNKFTVTFKMYHISMDDMECHQKGEEDICRCLNEYRSKYLCSLDSDHENCRQMGSLISAWKCNKNGRRFIKKRH